MRYTLCCLLFAALLAGASSCLKDPSVDPTPKTGRVLLAYMATDSNLHGLEQDKIDGLRAGWNGSPDDHIVAYVDAGGADSRLIEITGQQPRVIGSYGEENSADPAVLAHAIADLQRHFPDAESYGLLIFTHGWGWLPGLSYDAPYDYRTRSFALDSGYGAVMELSELAEAIPDDFFDYIVLEACFTAGIEVAYELRNDAPYILASSAEIVDPGFTSAYPEATEALLAGNLPEFGRQAFNQILTYPETDPSRSATLSVIRTAGLPPLARFIRDNCNFSRSVDIAEIQHFDRQDARLFFDFEDYYGRLLSSDDEDLRAVLRELIDSCVPWKASTETFMMQRPSYDGFEIKRHSGLTTYIPQPEFPGLNAAYASLRWARAIQN